MNDKTLSTHINKYHSNLYLNNLNNKVIILDQGATYIPKNFKKIDTNVGGSKNHSESLPESEDLVLFKRNVNTFLNKNRSSFSIGLLNINSLLHKFDFIKFLLIQNNLDILVFNETKLDKTRDSQHFSNPNYEILRRDRNKGEGGGGGIIVYIKKSYNSFNVNLHEDISSEIISFSIRFLQNDISFIGTYRPPHSGYEEQYFKDLESVVNS